jgi:3-dehydroquinate dehydratase type I
MDKYKIAVPIIGPSMDDALRDIDQAESLGVDIIELRLDCISKPNLEQLLKHSRLKKIATNRIVYEGGRFEGPEYKMVALLQEAVNLGVEYVDMELNYFNQLAIPRNTTQLIVSYHHFKKTPEHLEKIYEMIVKKSPDVVKIATMAQTPHDSLRMLNLVANAEWEIIGLCMGQDGIVTRVYGPVLGAYLTFASLPGKQSAPGQLTVEELRECWKRLKIE